MDVIHHLLPHCKQSVDPQLVGRNRILWFPEKEISMESFVVGALESTFHEMVKSDYQVRWRHLALFFGYDNYFFSS